MIPATAAFADGEYEDYMGDSYYEEQLARYEAMKNRTIDYTFINKGVYLVKNTKLYVIEVTGVHPDGPFIYSPWELVCDNDFDYVTLTLPGTCVMFAFGFDITWGTDWPYSDVFWTDNKILPLLCSFFFLLLGL